MYESGQDRRKDTFSFNIQALLRSSRIVRGSGARHGESGLQLALQVAAEPCVAYFQWKLQLPWYIWHVAP